MAQIAPLFFPPQTPSQTPVHTASGAGSDLSFGALLEMTVSSGKADAQQTASKPASPRKIISSLTETARIGADAAPAQAEPAAIIQEAPARALASAPEDGNAQTAPLPAGSLSSLPEQLQDFKELQFSLIPDGDAGLNLPPVAGAEIMAALIAADNLPVSPLTSTAPLAAGRQIAPGQTVSATPAAATEPEKSAPAGFPPGADIQPDPGRLPQLTATGDTIMPTALAGLTLTAPSDTAASDTATSDTATSDTAAPAAEPRALAIAFPSGETLSTISPRDLSLFVRTDPAATAVAPGDIAAPDALAQPRNSQPQDSRPQVTQPPVSPPQDSRLQVAQPPVSPPQNSRPQPTQPPVSPPQDSRPQLAQPPVSPPQDSRPQLAQPPVSPPQDSRPQLAQPPVSPPQDSRPQLAQPPVSPPQNSRPQLAQPPVFQPQDSRPQLAQPPVSLAEEGAALPVTPENADIASLVASSGTAMESNPAEPPGLQQNPLAGNAGMWPTSGPLSGMTIISSGYSVTLEAATPPADTGRESTVSARQLQELIATHETATPTITQQSTQADPLEYLVRLTPALPVSTLASSPADSARISGPQAELTPLIASFNQLTTLKTPVAETTEKAAPQESLRQEVRGQFMEARIETRDKGADTQGQQPGQQNLATDAKLLATPLAATATTDQTAAFFPLNQAVMSQTPPQHIAATPAPVTPPPGTPAADDFIFNQVAERFQIFTRNQETQLNIKLHPVELGELKIDLTMKEGSIRAHIVAQSGQVQEVLEKNMVRLKSILEGQGFTIDEILVSIKREDVGSFDLQQDQLSRGNTAAQQSRRHNDTTFDDTYDRVAAASTGSATGVNITA